MKFGQLTELTRKTFLFKTHAENRAGGLVPDLFFLKKKIYTTQEHVVYGLV